MCSMPYNAIQQCTVNVPTKTDYELELSMYRTQLGLGGQEEPRHGLVRSRASPSSSPLPPVDSAPWYRVPSCEACALWRVPAY